MSFSSAILKNISAVFDESVFIAFIVFVYISDSCDSCVFVYHIFPQIPQSHEK